MSIGREMDDLNLPLHGKIFQEGDFWNLSWSDGSCEPGGCGRSQLPEPVRIGLAKGPEGLSEQEAQQTAWEYIVSRLQRNTREKQPQMTIAEFVETKFVSEHADQKRTAGAT